MTGRLILVGVAVCSMVAVVGAAWMTARPIAATQFGSPPQRETQRREHSPAARERTVSAVAFLSRIIRLLATNDYARAWMSLDSRQRRLVPRAAYVRCESGSPIPGRLRSVERIAADRQRIAVPGAIREGTPSIVVTFRLTFAPLPGADPAVVRVKAHALRAHGRWAWMLPAERLELHMSGGCGASPPRGDPSL